MILTREEIFGTAFIPAMLLEKAVLLSATKYSYPATSATGPMQILHLRGRKTYPISGDDIYAYCSEVREIETISEEMQKNLKGDILRSLHYISKL